MDRFTRAKDSEHNATFGNSTVAIFLSHCYRDGDGGGAIPFTPSLAPAPSVITVIWMEKRISGMWKLFGHHLNDCGFSVISRRSIHPNSSSGRPNTSTLFKICFSSNFFIKFIIITSRPKHSHTFTTTSSKLV